MSPLFSIITVCYNAADDLQRTILSVNSQTCRQYEHIIIDGASTDHTQAVLDKSVSANRKIVSEPDNGIYDAMNKGLGMAEGDYLIFLNAGDRFHDVDTLATYAGLIDENNKPGIVYGQTALVDADGNYVGERHLVAPETLTYKSFADGMLVCHQSMAVLRLIAPLYNTRYRFSADYDWSVQCLQHSRKNVYTGKIMCDYLSEGMTTANRRASLIERFRIMSHYYGFFPTLFRHLGFVRRFIRYNNKQKKLQNH